MVSHGKLLERYFDLREEIASFLEEKGMPVPELHNSKWICDMAFSADVTKHLNILILSLHNCMKCTGIQMKIFIMGTTKP